MSQLNCQSKIEYSALSAEDQEKILQLQQSILESVSYGEDHKDIIDKICHLDEELLPNSVASVMLMDDKYELLNVYAAPSIPPDGVVQLNGLRPGPGSGSCGNVIYRQEPQFVNNTTQDDRWCDLRQFVYDFNLCACWSVPIYSSGKIIGTFALSSFECRSPSVFHRNLLEISASIIGIVLGRQHDETALRIAATAFESQDGMLITDADIRILQVNRAFVEITGYQPEEVIGKNPSMFGSGFHDANFYEALWQGLEEDGRWKGEIWNQRKNGEVYPQQLTITAVKDSGGKIINYVGSLSDITVRKKSEEEIQRLANYDHLTGLPNRRLFLDRLEHALANVSRTNMSGALLFIDLDNFKMLNDTWGHQEGDLLLKKIASRLLDSCREGDTVCRIGGDEFVVALENLSADCIEAAEQSKVVAEKILASIAEPIQLNRSDYVCTSSIGIALFGNGEIEAQELLKQADIAMYQAKNNGRNVLSFFDSKMQFDINSRARLEAELRQAMDKEQFQLHYQIQKDDAGHVTGAEALIRWIHPERGLVSPVEFIPIAEETDLILQIGRWVIESACAQLAAWASAPNTSGLVLAVNVSARQFHRPEFVEQVENSITRYGVDPSLLKLELTESLLLKDIEDTVSIMHALNAIGVQLSLDDFGTGYSSLQYLRRLPFDQLKIDQSFVRNITDGAGDCAIVYAIITMAKSLDLNVIAEGVETEAQKQRLLDCGCNNYQGYLFGKPFPIDQFESLLRCDLLSKGTH